MLMPALIYVSHMAEKQSTKMSHVSDCPCLPLACFAPFSARPLRILEAAYLALVRTCMPTQLTNLAASMFTAKPLLQAEA